MLIKEKATIFSPNKGSNLDIHFTIAGNEIEQVSVFKFLCIRMNNKLSFKDHGKHVV